MKVFRVAPLIVASCAVCFSASGDGWDFEAGYSRVQVDFATGDFDLGAIYGIAGYRWDYGSQTSGTLEAFASFGLQDDNIGPIEAEVDIGYGLAYRLNRKLNDDFSVFGRAIYAQYNLDLSAPSIGGGNQDADDSGAGFGIGASYRGVTLTYNQYFGDLATLDIGYRFGR